MKENTVLFVDDEENVLKSIKRGLMDVEYKRIFVTSALKALEVMSNEEVSVIVTDMRMPEMNGLDLIKIVKEKYPNTIRIVLSGYTQLSQVLATINQGDVFKFITKPWKLDEEFKPVVNEALEYYNLKRERDRLYKELGLKSALYKKILDSTTNKYNLFQTESKRIKDLGAQLFNDIKTEMNKEMTEDLQKNKMMDILTIHEKLFLGYLNILPSENIEFDLKRITKDANEILLERKPNNKHTFKINTTIEDKLFGSYKLVLFMLKTLMQLLFENDFCDPVVTNIKAEEAGETGEYIKLAILMENHINDIDYLYNKGSLHHQYLKQKIDIMQSFLNRISGYFEGGLILYEANRNIYIKLEMQFKKQISHNQ